MWKYVLFLCFGCVYCGYNYETKYFKVPLDHFGYQRNETFNIKYLVNDEHWDRNSGPIFFYTGNEGQIEIFAKHTGFMWENAGHYKAKLVFAEHRYYGTSMPFGNKSLDNEHIGYLTAAQALADYADLIDFLQGGTIHPRYPVIAFGGSYGGVLAAYFRMKYPHIVTGAIAASAPVHMYPGMVPCDVFDRIVTSSFKIANAKCVENIRQSWALIRKYASNATASEWLHKNWKLCDPIKDAKDTDTLIEFLQSMYETLAIVNYPFPSDFLMSLPAQPVRVVCQYLNESLAGDKLLEGIGKVLQVFTNYDGKNPCVPYKSGSNYGNLNASGWDYQVKSEVPCPLVGYGADAFHICFTDRFFLFRDYQTCTEMIMPMCTTGKDDMFEPYPWNATKYSENCHKKYNVYPRFDAARIEYGGNRLQAASNIVFSNGLLDPWVGGGILNSISKSITTVVIIDGAHHLDLMPSTQYDPTSVQMARSIHRQNIDQWLREFREQWSSRP